MKKILVTIIAVVLLCGCESHKDKLYKVYYRQCMEKMSNHQKDCFPRIEEWSISECRKWLQGPPREECLNEFFIKKYGVPQSQYKKRICYVWAEHGKTTQKEFCEEIAYITASNYSEEQARFKLKHGFK